MCGIAGILSKSGRTTPELKAAIERSVAALWHRGPDDSGIYCDARVILGSRRLSILDLSPTARMPIANEDQTVWIVFNGEIYNYQSLREDLVRKGHQFRSQSDTEVILHHYEEYGSECVKHLRGMFAFAIWDARKRRLFMARDRFGIKPLYYSHTPEFFIFSSEVRSLLASGLIAKDLNQESVARFLQTGSVPAPLTTVQNVFSLPAGNFLIYDEPAQTMRVEKYWGLEFAQKVFSSREEVVHNTRARLEESVRLHLLSDVPVGVFLSGGLDSSTLTALASQGRNDPLKTISVVFNEVEYNEANQARLIAERYATDHTEVLCSAQDFYNEIPLLFKSMDQPTVDGINTYFVCKAARQSGLKVVLSGLGGDEVFLGYKHFHNVARLNGSLTLFGKLPSSFRKTLLQCFKTYGRAVGYHNWKKLDFLAEPTSENYYLLIRGLYTSNQVQALLDTSAAYLAPMPQNYGSQPFNLDTLSYLEFNGYLQNQLLKDADCMSMAHSVEVRVPFLDHPLVEYLASIPPQMKLDARINKILLANAVSDMLPSSVYSKPKQGFMFPFQHWIRLYSRELREISSSSGLLAPKAVERIWNDFDSGRMHWSRPWALVVLSAVLKNE